MGLRGRTRVGLISGSVLTTKNITTIITKHNYVRSKVRLPSFIETMVNVLWHDIYTRH